MMRQPLPRIIAKWNLKFLSADLAAHLEALVRVDDLVGTCDRAEEFLEPYNLSAEDEYFVTMWGMGKQCVDCGDIRDFYMVSDCTWGAAGLRPDQCCCRKCLSARLNRPLTIRDFTPAG